MNRERVFWNPSPAAVLKAGALAGLLAGILMGVAATLHAGVTGGGWSLPWQMIAGTYYGPMAFVGGAGVTTIGVFTHLFAICALGIIFAVLTSRISGISASLVLGILYGIAVWAFMTYVTLAVIDQTMRVRVATSPTWWFFLHWIYGGLLGLFTPGIRRTFATLQVASPIPDRDSPHPVADIERK